MAVHARDRFPLIKDHVLLPLAEDIAGADERLSALLNADAIDGAIADVPDDWLGDDPTASRDAYRRYLLERLAPPRPFLSDIEAGNGA